MIAPIIVRTHNFVIHAARESVTLSAKPCGYRRCLSRMRPLRLALRCPTRDSVI
ncbi:uncharacterized protein DS421_6g186810 [Arachis hypogaea]|nr:uncharacterized protein DS421_6g186810 [Arachis hypogaea]